ncbi:uncharacterized protein LOC114265709 [Camellia sinensis]|uniref:uncharacterized protein LOC114265709 n=1 Tax=Camellia sinensis TaxID=4442 RepID=UPI001036EBF1|nr:uncharacterized protein LOC114265709 [Camellia sinensis]
MIATNEYARKDLDKKMLITEKSVISNVLTHMVVKKNGTKFRSSTIIAQKRELVLGLGFIDARYSGDWSRIGVISKETEDLLKLAAFVVVPWYSGDWSRIGVISKETEDLLKLAAFVWPPVAVPPPSPTPTTAPPLHHHSMSMENPNRLSNDEWPPATVPPPPPTPTAAPPLHHHSMPMENPNRLSNNEVNCKGEHPMGFALFTTPPFAIAAKDALQEMVFDEESNISVMSKPIWKQNLVHYSIVVRSVYNRLLVDPRFVWNRNILEELIENKLDGFIIPLLQGNILKLFNAYFVCACARMCLCMSTCVRVKGNYGCKSSFLFMVFSLNQGISYRTGQLKLKNSPAIITLISRRCTWRLGTRMWKRGANLEGSMSSFLQIRGSIPLIWEQIVDLSYKPRLNIIDHEQTSKVVERHFHDIIERYGETVAVDLTNKHGDEGQLSMAYATEMEKLPNVRYISFDFHHYCGNSNLDNIQVLYDQVSKDLQKEG